MASRLISIRLDASAVEALERLQISDDTSLAVTAKRVLLTSLGIDVNASVQGVNNASDERLQELIDNKTAYLAASLNELKHSLEGEIEVLRTRLDALTHSPAATAIAPKATKGMSKATEIQSENSNYVCPDCGAVGTKPNDFTSEGTTKSGTPKLKCKHCGSVRVESKFLAQEPTKSETWEQKASDLLDEVSWQ